MDGDTALSWLTSLVYMQDYMKEQQLPSALKHRVLDFFEYLWVRNKGTDRQSLLSDMPYCMHDTMNVIQTLYIGVYSASTGEWYMFFWSYCNEKGVI